MEMILLVNKEVADQNPKTKKLVYINKSVKKNIKRKLL
jgi:hypothetical protein